MHAHMTSDRINPVLVQIKQAEQANVIAFTVKVNDLSNRGNTVCCIFRSNSLRLIPECLVPSDQSGCCQSHCCHFGWTQTFPHPSCCMHSPVFCPAGSPLGCQTCHLHRRPPPCQCLHWAQSPWRCHNSWMWPLMSAAGTRKCVTLQQSVYKREVMRNRYFTKVDLMYPCKQRSLFTAVVTTTLTAYLCIHVIVMTLDHLLDLVRHSLSSLLTHLLVLDVCL